MEHKWNYEIYVNGELDYLDKLTAGEIEKIKSFIKNIKKKNEK